MKEIIIGVNEEDKRLDRFLSSYLKEAGTGFIYKMLRKKNITLNDRKADGKEKLKAGDSIKMYFSDETFEKFKGGANEAPSTGKNPEYAPDLLPVIYEDENIVLVNKPAGILSQKAKADDFSLNEWLIEFLLSKGEITKESLDTYRPSICNRLDRNTSGLVICAKSLQGAREMNSLIKQRSIDKFYRTVVEGRLTENMVLKGYLTKNERDNKVRISDKQTGDESSYIETIYYPLGYDERQDLTMLEVKLVTGKPHQIRAHLSSIGHPIIGDTKYGGRKSKGLSYQLLHSYRVVFPGDLKEPFEKLSGKEFTAPLPDALRKFNIK